MANYTLCSHCGDVYDSAITAEQEWHCIYQTCTELIYGECSICGCCDNFVHEGVDGVIVHNNLRTCITNLAIKLENIIWKLEGSEVFAVGNVKTKLYSLEHSVRRITQGRRAALGEQKYLAMQKRDNGSDPAG